MRTYFFFFLNILGSSITSHIFSDYLYLRVVAAAARATRRSVITINGIILVLILSLLVGNDILYSSDLCLATAGIPAMTNSNYISPERISITQSGKWRTYSLDVPNLILSD